MPEIVARRRVVRREVDESMGLGFAIAIALAIIALLALFALARGAFNQTPSQSSTQNQLMPGGGQSPTGGGVTY